jgi:hypothetical protein
MGVLEEVLQAIGIALNSAAFLRFILDTVGEVRGTTPATGLPSVETLFAAGFGLFFVGDVIRGARVSAVIDGVLAGLFALAWWRGHRKDRRKALDAIGAKSRALRDALVRRAREAARPRPVLRPQRGGVR